MKKVFRDLLDAKERLHDMQSLFNETLKENYPCLISEDTKEYELKLRDELEFLLSSSVKYKTGRIEIRAPRVGYREKVVLTRKPGLRAPHNAYTDFDLTDVDSIDEYGNLVIKCWNENAFIMLGALKVLPKKIDQEKLEMFYKFLKEYVNWKNNVHKIVNARYGCKTRPFFVGKGKTQNEKNLIQIKTKNFDIGILRSALNPAIQTYSQGWVYLNSSKFTDYLLKNSDGTIYYQDILEKVWENFDDFKEVLDKAEKVKVKLIEQGKDLLERVKQYNKPFKVLNKLLSK